MIRTGAMKKIVVFGFSFCLLLIVISGLLLMKAHEQNNTLRTSYSNNFSLLEDQILALIKGADATLEQVSHEEAVVFSDVQFLANAFENLDLLQKLYALMVQEYYMANVADFTDRLDYVMGLTFFHDLSNYLYAVIAEMHASEDAHAMMAQLRINEMQAIMEEVLQVYSQLENEQFTGLSEREKLHQRVVIQMELLKKHIELNQQAAQLHQG